LAGGSRAGGSHFGQRGNLEWKLWAAGRVIWRGAGPFDGIRGRPEAARHARLTSCFSRRGHRGPNPTSAPSLRPSPEASRRRRRGDGPCRAEQQWPAISGVAPSANQARPPRCPLSGACWGRPPNLLGWMTAHRRPELSALPGRRRDPCPALSTRLMPCRPSTVHPVPLTICCAGLPLDLCFAPPVGPESGRAWPGAASLNLGTGPRRSRRPSLGCVSRNRRRRTRSAGAARPREHALAPRPSSAPALVAVAALRRLHAAVTDSPAYHQRGRPANSRGRADRNLPGEPLTPCAPSPGRDDGSRLQARPRRSGLARRYAGEGQGPGGSGGPGSPWPVLRIASAGRECFAGRKSCPSGTDAGEGDARGAPESANRPITAVPRARLHAAQPFRTSAGRPQYWSSGHRFLFPRCEFLWGF